MALSLPALVGFERGRQPDLHFSREPVARARASISTSLCCRRHRVADSTELDGTKMLFEHGRKYRVRCGVNKGIK